MKTQTPIRFESIFADELTKYIKYKRSLGMQYDRPEYELVTFSKFLADNNVSEMTISKEIAEKWCCRRVDEGHKMWANRTGIYRQFAIYLNKNGYSAYIPPTPQRYITEYIPYIFTKEEILNIFDAADKYDAQRLNSYQKIMPLLVRLLFSTGLRISEVANLKYSDVDLSSGVLYIFDGKNGNDRIVPMHESLTNLLREYDEKYNKNNTYFFETLRHTQISTNACYKNFRKILFASGIPHQGRGKGPRLHDTRHTFAVHSLQYMIEQGLDIYVSLPYLSVYLGHKSITATEQYVRLTAEAYPELAEIISKYTGRVIPEV